MLRIEQYFHWILFLNHHLSTWTFICLEFAYTISLTWFQISKYDTQNFRKTFQVIIFFKFLFYPFQYFSFCTDILHSVTYLCVCSVIYRNENPRENYTTFAFCWKISGHMYTCMSCKGMGLSIPACGNKLHESQRKI